MVLPGAHGRALLALQVSLPPAHAQNSVRSDLPVTHSLSGLQATAPLSHVCVAVVDGCLSQYTESAKQSKTQTSRVLLFSVVSLAASIVPVMTGI